MSSSREDRTHREDLRRDPQELYRKIRSMRPSDVHTWLACGQLAYESHGGRGPCPCWMCEARRSYLASVNVPLPTPRTT